MKIYGLGGLGTSERLFARLDFGPHELVFIDLPFPTKNQDLSSYLDQISSKIDTNQPFMLLGFSFGGILANELAHQLKPQMLILCSSFVHPKELPLLVRLASTISLHKVLPLSLYKYDHPLTRFVLGLFGKGFKRLMLEIMKQAGPELAQWATGILLAWKGRIPQLNHIRIHGVNERVIPIKGLQNVDFALPGGHFLVLSHSKEVNKVLAEL